MNAPKTLSALWEKRGLRAHDWFAAGYEQALETIEDRTDDPQNPYYFGPVFNGSGFMTEDGPMVNDEISELDPETARQVAFEMLALADLAEVAPPPA